MAKQTKREAMKKLGESVTPGSREAKFHGCTCRGKTRLDEGCPIHRDVIRIPLSADSEEGDGA